MKDRLQYQQNDLPVHLATTAPPRRNVARGTWSHTVWCAALIFLLGATAFAASSSVTLDYKVINNFPVKMVLVNMQDPEVVVTTALANNFPTGLERWQSYLDRLQPDAAINGTYFCLRSNMPVGDVAVDGSLRYRGVVGTALCITMDNQVVMRPGPQQMKPNWLGFRTVLCAGPRLLTDGRITINARAEGFRDPRVLGSAPRSAVAMRPDGVLILLTIKKNISLTNLAYVCQSLGATNAMCLDGGNSSGLYADGRTVSKPGRGLSNILAVYASQRKFQAALPDLSPGGLPILAELLPSAAVMFAENIPALGGSGTMPKFRPLGTAKTTQPTTSAVRILQPTAKQPVHGTVSIAIDAGQDTRASWATLRINGKLRAMSNTWPFQVPWDSTKETDGTHVLEVTVWSRDQVLLGRDVVEVNVHNAEQVANR
ncbi:MAG: phosphodiester glycosidase family protein [Armatimonadota bacterium]